MVSIFALITHDKDQVHPGDNDDDDDPKLYTTEFQESNLGLQSEVRLAYQLRHWWSESGGWGVRLCHRNSPWHSDLFAQLVGCPDLILKAQVRFLVLSDVQFEIFHCINAISLMMTKVAQFPSSSPCIYKATPLLVSSYNRYVMESR